jgi:hypothetical protein
MLRATIASLIAALVLATAALAASSPPKPRSGGWSGTTAQFPIDGSITAKAKKGNFRKGSIKWTAHCDNRPDVTDTIAFGKAEVSGGKFKLVGGGNGSEAGGASYTFDYALKGKLKSKKKATGTWKVHLIFYDGNNKQTAECKSGSVSFTLKHS